MERLTCSTKRGAQALIQEKSLKAVYTHCRAHCLNFPIVHSCDQPLIRNMLLEHSVKFTMV